MPLRCSWKSSLVFKNIPKSFWVNYRVIILLSKINESWDDFWILWEKITSWACLLGSRLKLIFHCKPQLFAMFKSSFKFFADLSNITEKRDVSSANILAFEPRFTEKSFIYIKKSSGLRIEPSRTPASILTHVEFWPFRTTLCLLSFRKSAKVFS